MTVKSLFAEPSPIIPRNVAVSGGDSADIKVCYCVVSWCLANFLGGFEC